MDKRNREILSALVDRLRYLLRKALLTNPPESTPRHTLNEQTVYLWLIRLLTLRTIEARGLHLPGWQADPNNSSFSTRFSLFPQDHTSPPYAEFDRAQALKQACAELARPLPGLFALDDQALAALAGKDALSTCLRLLCGQQPTLPGVTRREIDTTFADPDALGWAYQFYQAEARTEINLKCKHGGKVTNRAELAAKTQLFTEPYMVQWLLQNSLGRSYVEAYPHSALPANWPYFIQPDHEKPDEPRYSLEDLTLLDPCMGCGHILRVAFDLFAAMYGELHPEMSASAITERIFRQHLFGIDLDPRAAQISALVLSLRAWEFIQSTQPARAEVFPALPEMRLATIPGNFAPGALQRHLQRYPQDSPYTPELEVIFHGLEQVETLGSLLQMREVLAQIEPETAPQSLSDSSSASQPLQEHIFHSYALEKSTPDSAWQHLTGHQVAQNALLLHLLNRRYTLIVTNPPYLDSRDMNEQLRQYIAAYYPSGKRDLYAAFLLRCFSLCQDRGRIAVVTMQSWLFNRSFADLRAAPTARACNGAGDQHFAGLLRETCIEALVHLGTHAFAEIAGEIVQCAMLTLARRGPDQEFRMRAWRLVGLKSGEAKRAALIAGKNERRGHFASRPRQCGFLELAEAPVVYYLSNEFMKLIAQSARLQEIAHVRQGLATADNTRFTRCCWEISTRGTVPANGPATGRWFRYAKGGAYQKWAGLMWLVVDWEQDGQRIKLGVDPRNRPRYRDNAPQFAFRPGLTYTFIASGSFGTRILRDALFDVAGTALFPKNNELSLCGLAAITSSRVVSYLLRVLTQDLKFNAGYVAQTPLAPAIPWPLLHAVGTACIRLKQILVAQNPIEDTFTGVPVTLTYEIQAMLHSLEGWNESIVCETYRLHVQDREAIIAETGTPAGWYPLLAGYDRLPDLSLELDEVFELPQEFMTFLSIHTRSIPAEQELERIKARLRQLYMAGPRTKKIDLATGELNGASKDEETFAGTYLPIPAETFLEELSIKMQLHPLSVYWLLEELRAIEDLHCESEERRLLEERLSVLVLRLLGHRWPRQVEECEPTPAWAEPGGIIPLVTGAGQRTLAERVRERLRAEEGPEESHRLEQHLRALTGQELEQWLRDSFFERHITQFKRRPIAWHLASTPTRIGAQIEKKLGARGHTPIPAFACLVSYHACGSDLLARLRTRYLEPLLHNEREKLTAARVPANSLALLAIQERIQELEAFSANLQNVEQQGFACPELDKIAEQEILDHWSGDGAMPPPDRATFQNTEVAWHIDFNDGVRVNIAPLQLAGLLTRDVLTTKDARIALSNRAHWRADERRWVRAGKLPRCGWMEARFSQQQNYVPSL